MLPTGSGVAWMAHVGGFLAGLGLVRLLANPPPTQDEIAVSGVIVHITPLEGADPHVAARAGILLTDVSPDWLALCRRLARMASRR